MVMLKLEREKMNFTLAQKAAVRYSSVPRNATQQTARNEARRSKVEGVDELHAVPHNLASLLTNKTLRQVSRIFKNQQSISVGV
jgi:hypothetical protein